MDPFTAIGLVSGILSFVGAAEEILKLSWTLYNSVEGSSEETDMRRRLTGSMGVILSRIVPANQSAPAEEDRALVALARECNELTIDITRELQTLRPRRRKSKAQSGLVALKTLMVERKLKDLERRLQYCRDQLHFHIATLSSENLKALLATCKEDGAKLAQLELSVTLLRQTLQDMATAKTDPISEAALRQLQNLLSVGQDALNEVAQDRILRGIKAGFEDIFYRYQSVDSTFGGTFEWILDLDGTSPEAAKFTQWLSSGDGIFHICGKLGAGKSTLMKKLCGSKRTRTELEKWSHAKGGRELITATYFFYALGSDPRQKSLMGLYRTLLYQIATKSPGLVQILLPDQWAKAISQPKTHSAFEILDDDIRQAYERLSRQRDDNALGGYSFCFFIDGLDEYQTTTAVDRREMVRSLTDLANSASGCFKLCVSSRIENPFMDVFSEDARLYLHELTKPDMEEYVQGNLQCVGIHEERRQLASSITAKAEGVFLWVVLVVQNIRRLSDDGAKFSRLLGEIESLPTEMNELFQRIVDTLGAVDRRLVSHTVSLLRFLGGIPDAKKMHLWLTLGDFYFLPDYEADLRFAQSAQFPEPTSETAKESELRARRQLRGVCRGLVEADKADGLGFVHRSVGDFFDQEKVRIEMHDESFHDLEALSQLKLASVKQYWLDAERQTGNEDGASEKTREEVLSRHSILVTSLIERRRRQQLDAPPFAFLACIDTIPALSVGTTIGRARARHKTAFRTSLSWKTYLRRETKPYSGYEICHTSRVRHTLTDSYDPSKYYGESAGEDFHVENSTCTWRQIEEDVDKIEDYSIAVISPLFIELCSGRLGYPLWRTAHIADMPLESEGLAMLVYCAIGAGMGRTIWRTPAIKSGVSAANGAASDDDDDDDDGGNHCKHWALVDAGLVFLRHLFEPKIVSPNLPTRLAFGSELGFVRIAAGDQRLTIWQHFLCWWATVAAASGEFELEAGPGEEPAPDDETPSDDESASDDEYSYDPNEQYEAGVVLETFIGNGADLQLALKIAGGQDVESGQDDWWIQLTIEMVPDGGEALELDVVVNLKCRMDLGGYPYGPPKKWSERKYDGEDRPPLALPNSPLSVRNWISRSRLPNKDALLRLIDERLEAAKQEDTPTTDPTQDGRAGEGGCSLKMM